MCQSKLEKEKSKFPVPRVKLLGYLVTITIQNHCSPFAFGLDWRLGFVIFDLIGFLFKRGILMSVILLSIFI